MTDKQSIWFYTVLTIIAITGSIALSTHLTIQNNKCIANAAKIALKYNVPVAETMELCR